MAKGLFNSVTGIIFIVVLVLLALAIIGMVTSVIDPIFGIGNLGTALTLGIMAFILWKIR